MISLQPVPFRHLFAFQACATRENLEKMMLIRIASEILTLFLMRSYSPTDNNQNDSEIQYKEPK